MKKLMMVIIGVLALCTTAHADDLGELVIAAYTAGLYEGAQCQQVASEAETDEQAETDLEACIEAMVADIQRRVEVITETCAKEAQ